MPKKKRGEKEREKRKKFVIETNKIKKKLACQSTNKRDDVETRYLMM